jgi:hypothetical protein
MGSPAPVVALLLRPLAADSTALLLEIGWISWYAEEGRSGQVAGFDEVGRSLFVRASSQGSSMDDVPILGSEDERRLVNLFLSHHGAPAYVRRAREVEEAFRALIERCRRQRDEWLNLVRIRLGTLRELAGDWERLRTLLSENQLDMVRRLHAELEPRLRVPVAVTGSARALRRALHELRESLESFNRRWSVFLTEVSLDCVNELREGYNRYYILEKECAVRSPQLARQGFRPLPPATAADLEAQLPPLPVP